MSTNPILCLTNQGNEPGRANRREEQAYWWDREIEVGMCDEDIIVLDPQITYHYNHLHLAEVCKRISEMSFQDDFEDALKNPISDCNRWLYNGECIL